MKGVLIMNANFENYPTPEQVDAHGFDCIHPTTRKVLENFRTYEQAREFCDGIVADNTRKNREYLTACRKRADALHFNATHEKKYAIKVPEAPKKPRLSAVPTIRWYEPGKAPLPADTGLSA